ncbi:MAG TPA: hypothetical protein VGG08_04575 [Solirubrobacteraceae bacterium]|jgi:hypothetical protein
MRSYRIERVTEEVTIEGEDGWLPKSWAEPGGRFEDSTITAERFGCPSPETAVIVQAESPEDAITLMEGQPGSPANEGGPFAASEVTVK